MLIFFVPSSTPAWGVTVHAAWSLILSITSPINSTHNNHFCHWFMQSHRLTMLRKSYCLNLLRFFSKLFSFTRPFKALTSSAFCQHLCLLTCPLDHSNPKTNKAYIKKWGCSSCISHKDSHPQISPWCWSDVVSWCAQAAWGRLLTFSALCCTLLLPPRGSHTPKGSRLNWHVSAIRKHLGPNWIAWKKFCLQQSTEASPCSSAHGHRHLWNSRIG